MNNFADALIIQFLNQPLEIFKKLENKKKNFIIDDENKLAIAIFRSRDIKDIELYTDEQIYDDEEFESIIQNSGLNFDTIIYLFLNFCWSMGTLLIVNVKMLLGSLIWLSFCRSSP